MENPFLRFTTEPMRQRLADGTAFPADGTNVATIDRSVTRTIPTSSTNSAPRANPDAIKSTGFPSIVYEDGNRVFLVSDDAEGGDEFKVDGYVSPMMSTGTPDFALKTGLKITSSGVEIRTGGPVITATVTGSRAETSIAAGKGDYLDLRKKLSVPVGTGALDTAGWDLTIALDKPDTRSAPTDNAPRGVTSWAGNGEFYWRAIAKPDPRQLNSEETDYYATGLITQPANYRRLGTYDLILSNHIGVDLGAEPTEGSRITSFPDDDLNYYLEYAAYGMFLFTGDTSINLPGPTVETTSNTARFSRVQAMHFGYEAFEDKADKRTRDIGTAITRGTFRGQTRAFAFKGNKFPGASFSGGNAFESKHLRGDVTLKVSIPKSTDSGTLSGTMNNFAE